jgi:hypothetical protein
MRDRSKIKNLTWSSINPGSEQDSKQWCKPCYSSGLGKLIPSPKPDEKNMLYCRNCGKSYSIEAQTETKQKLKLKHGEGPSKPFIISQQNKREKRKTKFDSVNNELGTEELEELRSMGFRV